MEGQQPHESDVTFLLEPAPTLAMAASDEPSAKGRDETVVVFCVDVSGSMNTPVKDMTGTFSGVTRLSAAQTAIKRQLDSLKQKFPYRRVALVAFESEVHIYGDGLPTYIFV